MARRLHLVTVRTYVCREVGGLYIGRSWFSLQEDTLPVETLVAQATQKGLKAIVLADRGALYGVPTFVRACREKGIKPIIGCSLTAGGGSFFLIAISAEGYRSLCRLVTHVRTQGRRPVAFPGALALWTEWPGLATSGLVTFVSDPAQARLHPGGFPTYVMLDARAPKSRNQELLAAGLPVIAVDTGEVPLSPDRLSDIFKWCPEALRTACEVELACADSFPASAPRLPQVPGDIRELARRGLEQRFREDVPYDRLDRAVREAGRRLGTPRELVDVVAGALPQDGSIRDAVRTLPEFRYLNAAREPPRSLLETAAKGPSQSGAIATFCDRRQGREKVRYLHPSLEPILGERTPLYERGTRLAGIQPETGLPAYSRPVEPL